MILLDYTECLISNTNPEEEGSGVVLPLSVFQEDEFLQEFD